MPDQSNNYDRADQSRASINTNSSANAGNSNTDENAVHLAGGTLQSAEEYNKDKHSDHSKEEDTITDSGIDDLQSNSDGAAGTDRAGTAERKTYGDVELNKGLEAQAKDLEGS
jgi:hypothetical protein